MSLSTTFAFGFFAFQSSTAPQRRQIFTRGKYSSIVPEAAAPWAGAAAATAGLVASAGLAASTGLVGSAALDAAVGSAGLGAAAAGAWVGAGVGADGAAHAARTPASRAPPESFRTL